MNERLEQITVDEETAKTLRTALYEVDVCGPDGEVLGTFRSGKLIQLYGDIKPPISREEMRSSSAEETGCTTEEMLARLGAEPCPTK